MAKKPGKKEPKKDLTGALPGFCTHRLPVVAYCKRCGA